MSILTQILAFLLAIFILVTIHEFGHFWVARRLGVKVQRFSIGFGRALWRYIDKRGTEFRVAWLPLGGYVKMLDEREGPVADNEKHLAFNRQALWRRAAVVVAGPLFNILLAIVAYYLMFIIGISHLKPIIGDVLPNTIAARAKLKPHTTILTIDQQQTQNWQDVSMAIVLRMGDEGIMAMQTQKPPMQVIVQHVLHLKDWQLSGLKPKLLESLGIKPYFYPILPVVQEIMPNTPASKAGFKKGDRIVAVNGKAAKDWREVVELIHKYADRNTRFTVLRGSKKLTLIATPTTRRQGFSKVGFLGVMVNVTKTPQQYKILQKYALVSAIIPSFERTWQILKFNTIVFTKMIMGKISYQALGGPIAVFQTADAAFRQGVAVYLSFLGLLSLMLAFVNILPIPGLDGGHLLFYLIELVMRRPLSLRMEVLLTRLGVILVVLLIVQATANDLWRLF